MVLSTMKVLFTTTHSYLPYFYGGSELSTHELVCALRAHGHEGAVNVSHGTNHLGAILDRARGKLSARKGFAKTKFDNYTVYRSWSPVDSLPKVLSDMEPDIGVAQAGDQGRIVRAHVSCHLPVVLYVRDVEFKWQSAGDYLSSPLVRFVANSRFTADAIKKKSGQVADIIPPLIHGSRYYTPEPGNAVVMINPHPVKGVDVMLQLAKLCPDIPFITVRGWGLSAETEAELAPRYAELPNVRQLPSTDDMRAIYAQAKLLLVPTSTPYLAEPVDFPEAWGRVVTEAQFSGIPVLASDDGGLPESVGPGGLLVDRNAPIESWHKAIRGMWDDPDEYSRLREAARRHAMRDEIQPTYLYEKFIRICLDHIAASKRRHAGSR